MFPIGSSNTYLYNVQSDTYNHKLVWDTSINNEECIHVSVLTNNTEEADIQLEKSIDEILNLNKYKCYICNIDVPKTYAAEHNNSVKHKTCCEIANIALERTKNQMQVDVAIPRKIEVVDTYFCEPCATVVLNTDKEKHEATKKHKIYHKHTELLCDMLKIYEDIKNVVVVPEVDELELLKDRIEQELRLQNTEISCEKIDAIDYGDKVKSEIKINNLTEDRIIQKSLQSVESQDTDTHIENRNAIAFTKLSNNEGIEYPAIMPKRGKKKSKKMLVTKKKVFLHDIPPVNSTDKESEDAKSDCKYIKITKVVNFKKDELNEQKKHIYDDKINKVHVYTEVDQAVTCLDKNFDASSSIKNKNIKPIGIDKILDNIDSKINSVLLKYFDGTRTVDALNNNTKKEYNKNKVSDDNKDINKKSYKPHIYSDSNDIHIQSNQEPDNHFKEHTTINDKSKNVLFQNKKEQNQKSPEQEKKDTIHKIDEAQQNKTGNPKTTDKESKQNISNVKLNKINKAKHEIPKDQIKKQDNAKPMKLKAPSFNLVCYLKDISRRCEIKPIHTIEALTDTVIQITAINGDKFKVLVNNFHSFHVKTNDFYCKVCETPNVRRPEWHIVESGHRTKVMTPIQDLNGIRQLDDMWSHCILCNDLTRHIDFHLQSLHHQKKVTQALVQLGQDSTENNQVHENKTPKKNTVISELMKENNLAMTSKGYLNCIVCDVIVDYDLQSVKQHVNSFHHLHEFELKLTNNKVVNVVGERFYCIACDKQLAKIDVVTHCSGKKHDRLLQELCVTQGEKKDVEEEDDEIMVLTSISQNVKNLGKNKMANFELICFVCNITIFSTEEHTDTFDHKKNYLSYLESNKLNEIEPDTLYCIPCNTVIGIDYLMSHCMGKKHKRILRGFLYQKTGHETDSKIDNGDKTDCNVHKNQKRQDDIDCNVYKELNRQDNTDCNVYKKQNRQDNTGYNVNKEQNQQDNKDCNVLKDNNRQDDTDSNVDEKDHEVIGGIINSELENNETNSPIPKPIGNSHNIAMPLKVLYQFQELNPSKLLCIVCDEEVTYTRKLALHHVSTLDHVVAFNLMMLWNKIKKRVDKYFCDICLLDITYFSEISHVLGKVHTDNIARQAKGTVYEYDRTLVTHAYAMSHKVGHRVRPSPVVSVKSLEI